MAEGVGFEPTVGCPTLDFESSALNRTQPSLQIGFSKRLNRLLETCQRGRYLPLFALHAMGFGEAVDFVIAVEVVWLYIKR